MSQNNEFKELVKLACDSSKDKDLIHARAFLTACTEMDGSRAHFCNSLAKLLEFQRLMGLSLFVFSASVMLMVFAFSRLLGESSLNMPSIKAFFLMCSVISFVCTFFSVLFIADIRANKGLLGYFKPLNSQPEHCFELKKLSERSPDVANYVKSVVGSHEELTIGDLRVAHALEKGAEKKVAIDRGSEACRELHGLVS